MKTKSSYHNVYWYKATRSWIVKLHARNNPSGKETINVGYYPDEIVAAKVADWATYLVDVERPKYNFPFSDGQPTPLPLAVPVATLVERLLKLGAIRIEPPSGV